MSAANGRSAERRLRRRRRKLAAATSTVLLVAAAVAGEPISLAAGVPQVAGGIGGGLKGMTDPSEVGASGRLNEDDEIGSYLLDNADDVDSLLKLGGDAPSEDELGIPSTMYPAYENAADVLAEQQPNCNLDWSLLASIGRIESNHARGGKVDDNGDTVPKIYGPVLDGGGFAAIRDTDGGVYDGDSRWDRAVGNMQFIPSTWLAYASDGNDDGVKSPHNVYDETLAAGKFLCSGGLDLSKDTDRKAAVFRYNHSDSYVATVLLWADAYANGFTPMPGDYAPADDGGDDNFAYGPPSIGDLPPVQTPTTNPPAPPGGGGTTSTTNPTSTGSTAPTSSSGGPRTTAPQPTTTTPCTPPPSTDPTTTTTESALATGDSVPAEGSGATTTTDTTTTTTTPPATC
ncbi:lytic transglycosylase domain-containing protein [Actinophytocola sp.]|uniref:lytic transglycosylase domain-containing protein n=1 Tax=Actinophytocola sp. TaxID=1872138 RepID=UPI00389A9CB5